MTRLRGSSACTWAGNLAGDVSFAVDDTGTVHNHYCVRVTEANDAIA